ncbi:hypothetical protein HDV57DRAFT_248253 [Trichoderma longibrachiatum]|uniref:Uncharacterized protein n=1 Tax=Trichoderma longibrachiatum ATCC 18648 TaxID=983965 RepID=A0A2T4C9N1_TRILO|nr:hypothetical protein M440DRAFT_257962 [Trichoderma longibrachiatum ATCC 18648]
MRVACPSLAARLGKKAWKARRQGKARPAPVSASDPFNHGLPLPTSLASFFFLTTKLTHSLEPFCPCTGRAPMQRPVDRSLALYCAVAAVFLGSFSSLPSVASPLSSGRS